MLHSISIGLLPSSYTAQKAVLLSQQKSKSNENKLGKIGKIGKGLTDQTEKKELAGNFQTPDCIKDFNDSAEYFQLCLSNLDPRFRLMKGNKIRFHNNWQNLRETFPENFITKKNIENGFTPSNLAEMGMDLASPEKVKNNIDIGVSEVSNLKDKNYLDHDDNFKKVEVEVEVVPNQSESLHFNNSSNNKNKNKSGDNERFNSMSDREIDKNKSSRSTSNHVGRGSSNGVQEENLGGVMDLSITQIFKMSSVINNQWLKINT